MDINNYREVISNPWSWFFTADMLYQNADGLYELYNRYFDIEWEYMQKSRLYREKDYELDWEQLVELGTLPPHQPSAYSVVPVYMMLMGMAIENMVKGITVARKLKANPQISENASLKSLGIRGHTAPDLIKALGIELTDIEHSLLKDANEHLVWSGRYAAPADEGKEILPKTIMDLDPAEIEEYKIFDTINALYNRLKDIFDLETEQWLNDDLSGKTYLYRKF